ncbi:MAG: hypothetical protein PHN31_00300 [Candidatus Gracilibacteria bacterium]|nr:hypothetical protein [Candidatus Gracilibacteria bacterium]
MFKKEELGVNNIGVIDIGSYKIKVANCKFKKDEIDIVSYAEKRQEQDIILNGEISDLKGLCENLRIALKKVDPNNQIKKIIINSITPDVFLVFSRVIFERENRNEKIKREEIFHILKNKELECIDRGVKKIKSKTGYIKEDLKILFSNINQIFIDNNQVKDIYGKVGKDVLLSITNIFIPNSKYEVFEEIGKILNKEIITIIPEEYSVTKLFDDTSSVAIINIGNLNTFITIKKAEEVIGSSKINIGMNDLFKKIKQKQIIPTEKIIKNLEKDFYDEKKIFLETLGECIILALQEITEGRVCPNRFFITGGGGKSQFIRDYIKKIDYNSNNIKMLKSVELVDSDFTLDLDEIKKVGTDNVNLLSMVFIAYKIFYDEESIVKDILKEVMMEID